MIDATPNLQRLVPGIVVDATVSRQAGEGVALVQSLAATGRMGRSLVIHLGTNGTFTATQFVQLLTAAAGRRVVVVTDHCGYCSWAPSNNAMIRSGCTPSHNCAVADWDTLADQNPQWFGGDGVHMPIGGTGGQAYALLVLARLL